MSFTPTFIGGCGRSGTTLLVDLLGLHPQLSPIYETDFVVRMPQLYADAEVGISGFMPFVDRWSAHLPHRPHSKKDYERYFHGPHHLLFTREEIMDEVEKLIAQLQEREVFEQCFAGFIKKLFAAHCKRDGKPYWINKTPVYVMHLDFLQRLFPEMRFLHVVRNEMDVARSIVSRPWGPATLEQAIVYCQEHVAAGRAWGGRNPRQYRELEYEKLLLSSEQEITAVLNWLGLDPSIFPYQQIRIQPSMEK